MIAAQTDIRPCSFLEILLANNASGLLDEYAAECSIPAIGKISPQPQIYRTLEENRVMQCFGAFDGDRLIGFANVLVSVMPHYGRKLATIESLFVGIEHRHGTVGTNLMRTVEGYASAMGCEGIFYSAPAGGKLEALLEAKKAYRRTNAVFFRSL